MKKLIATAVITAVGLAGCATPTTYIDSEDTTTNVAAAITSADFAKAANSMADEIITNKNFVHPKRGERYVLYVSNIDNDTMQNIDTDQLIKSMRTKFLNSGTFFVTTAFGEDSATSDMRELKNSKMVKQSTVKGDNKVLAPDFSLSGKILERQMTLDNGDARIEYYFQLTITNIENGLSYWEGERVVGKVSDSGHVTW